MGKNPDMSSDVRSIIFHYLNVHTTPIVVYSINMLIRPFSAIASYEIVAGSSSAFNAA